MRRTTALIPAAITALALAGCGSAGSASTAGTASGPASATAQAAASPSSSPDCTSQFIAWRDAGDGKAQLLAVETDLGQFSTAAGDVGSAMGSGSDASSAESALQSAAASLQSDDDAAEANLPPACVPGLRRDISQGLTEYSKAASDAQNAVSEIGSGSYTVADGDIKATVRAEDAGTAAIIKGAGAMKAFNNS